MKVISYALIPVLLAVSACGSSYDKPVKSDTVLVDIRDGSSIKGRYDPTGFSSKNVRKMAASMCTGDKLASYSESAVDGQVVFDVTCKKGNKYGQNAGVFFKRTGANSVLFAATHSVNGQLVQTKGDLAL